MIVSGSQLKNYRESINLSQAKLAEATGISQHILSAFELGKINIGDSEIQKITHILSDKEKIAKIQERRKRYKRHSYTGVQHDPVRLKKYKKTAENKYYISELNSLLEPVEEAFTGVSLFAGCGGFSLGFKNAGCVIKGFVELDDDLSSIYQKNFPSAPKIGSDIAMLSDSAIRQFILDAGNIDVVIGGPPCQGFSLSGKRKADDPRNQLFKHYMRFIDIVRPKIAVIENVRLLTSMKNPDGRLVKDEILLSFDQLGYYANFFEINACNYGVPQHRERVIFIAIRKDIDREPSIPVHEYGHSEDLLRGIKKVRTFGDACSDLPYLESGEKSADLLHAAVSHPDHVIQWLWNVPEGRSAHDNDNPLLRPPSGYNTTYKRQVWDEPGATVQTTFGMISGCRNVHPVATRSLTIREAARLQSFPDKYIFSGTQGIIRTGIGNAVPPLLARALAIHIRALLTDFVEISSL
ncbi:MAG: DNA (cytosine-5-)-methyltransferase [Alphaproteobacteria bacterium]|nr:DNA (cytosine-5-)-methyltransferase [Alphaproteobacteria bacterium]